MTIGRALISHEGEDIWTDVVTGDGDSEATIAYASSSGHYVVRIAIPMTSDFALGELELISGQANPATIKALELNW